MNSEKFYDAILESYFKAQTCNIADMALMVAGVFQPAGEVVWQDEMKGDVRTITFREIDIYKSESGEEVDMSGVLMRLTLDKVGRITIVTHSLNFLTMANKNVILFLGSILGKTINH